MFTAPEVVIQGAVSPDATVSVNGLLASVDPSGSFQTDVPLALAEGHNLIEIVASDLEGNVISQVLTLIYLP